jgi:branched-chain amino acid transport system permease protein
VEILLSGQLLFAALSTGAFYALIGLGLNLVYGTMRLLNVAHGDIMMIGAYIAFWGFTWLGISPALGIIVAACAGVLLGWLVYLGLFRRMLASPALLQRLEGNSLLVFFGVSVILQNLTALFFSASPRGYRYLDDVYHLGDVAMTGNRLMVLGVALAICLAVYLLLRFHTFGLAIKALIERRDAALIVGINLDRVQLVSLCLGFAISAVAGVLISTTKQISPFMGFPFTISAFIVIILGGLGNIKAGLVAGFLLGVVEVFGVALTSASFQSVLVYGVFVAVLLARPQGLLGRGRMAR